MIVTRDDAIVVAEPLVTVQAIMALPGHRLWLRFTTGVEGEVDLTPLLHRGVFARLADPVDFQRVGLDRGVPTWPEQDVDLSPEYLYELLTS